MLEPIKTPFSFPWKFTSISQDFPRLPRIRLPSSPFLVSAFSALLVRATRRKPGVLGSQQAVFLMNTKSFVIRARTASHGRDCLAWYPSCGIDHDLQAVGIHSLASVRNGRKRYTSIAPSEGIVPQRRTRQRRLDVRPGFPLRTQECAAGEVAGIASQLQLTASYVCSF